MLENLKNVFDWFDLVLLVLTVASGIYAWINKDKRWVQNIFRELVEEAEEKYKSGEGQAKLEYVVNQLHKEIKKHIGGVTGYILIKFLTVKSVNKMVNEIIDLVNSKTNKNKNLLNEAVQKGVNLGIEIGAGAVDSNLQEMNIYNSDDWTSKEQVLEGVRNARNDSLKGFVNGYMKAEIDGAIDKAKAEVGANFGIKF